MLLSFPLLCALKNRFLVPTWVNWAVRSYSRLGWFPILFKVTFKSHTKNRGRVLKMWYLIISVQPCNFAGFPIHDVHTDLYVFLIVVPICGAPIAFFAANQPLSKYSWSRSNVASSLFFEVGRPLWNPQIGSKDGRVSVTWEMWLFVNPFFLSLVCWARWFFAFCQYYEDIFSTILLPSLRLVQTYCCRKLSFSNSVWENLTFQSLDALLARGILWSLSSWSLLNSFLVVTHNGDPIINPLQQEERQQKVFPFAT